MKRSMNDVEQVRAVMAPANPVRPSTPVGHPDDQEARRLLATILAPDESRAAATLPFRRRARGHRAMLAGAGLATLAATAAAVVVVAPNSGTTPRQPGSIRLEAATVLDKAADAADAQPATRPGPHQWIYLKSTHIAPGQPLGTDVQWLRADGRQLGFLQNGKLVVHPVSAGEAGGYSAVDSYNTLAKLPTDPHALLTRIYQLPQDGNGLGSGSLAHQILGAPPLTPLGTDRNSAAFLNIAQLIWNSPVGAPPKIQAALYRAMAEIPGIKVDANARTITGQPAISLSGLLFDPHTYRMLGARTVASDNTKVCDIDGAPTPKPAAKKPHDCHPVPAGTVMDESLQTTVKYVDGPGRR